MQTLFHILLAFVIVKYYKVQKDIKIPKSYIVGSFAPDILLFLFTFFGFLYYRYIQDLSTREIFTLMFDTLYFTNPWWIFSYNVLHSPLIVITALIFIYFIIKNNFKLYHSLKINKSSKIKLSFLKQYFPTLAILLFFFLGCLTHIALDIPVHYDDGPLLLYPLNDELRFQSPISYWDNNYYANVVSIVERVLMILFILYLSKDFFIRKYKLFVKKCRRF